MSQSSDNKDDRPPLIEGRDYYLENGRYVFTAYFLLQRGYCCGSGCRHCPYPTDPAGPEPPGEDR